MKQHVLSHINTVKEFNSEIRKEQENTHGVGYCDIHDAIFKFLTNNDSYMELGVNQGGTLSAALMMNPKEVCIVDINLDPYKQYLAPLAREYCNENIILLEELECSSHDEKTLREVDVLLIDTVHNSNFMKKELELHAKNVSKYIIAHDTSMIARVKNDSLFKTLDTFCKKSKGEWEVVERNNNSVGYTVIGRKNN